MLVEQVEALKSIQEAYVAMNSEQLDEGFAHPNHKKLDANGNGKVDAHDFELLRKKKGIKNFKEFKESLEQLDELSQGLKDRYVKAATANKNVHSSTQKQHTNTANKHMDKAYASHNKISSLNDTKAKINKNFNPAYDNRDKAKQKIDNVNSKIAHHSDTEKHHKIEAGMHKLVAQHSADKVQKREAGIKRATPANKPSLFQRFKKKIGLGEEVYLEDYSIEELEDFMMSEELELIDELSKNTIELYIKEFKD